VIVGRLIPAGTGLAHHNARKRAKLAGPEAVAAGAEAFETPSEVPAEAVPMAAAGDLPPAA
jgi:DNA-directed RNA polymerase subunit beta'